MDWPRDSGYLSRSKDDLKRVFEYDWRPTTVVRILERNEVSIFIFTGRCVTNRVSLNLKYAHYKRISNGNGGWAKSVKL
jgi:hypothetical protein